MAASGQLGDGAGYGDQRLRRSPGDVGAAQPPFQHRPFQPEHRLFPAAADTAARIFAVAVVRLAQIRRERRV